ncbi:hypothetical protein GCM10010302_04930 [Streptomyces polychromogenes]|uniref:Uncharacterized protein n=1 Tax=Streptomyces polychromogenes TaxID=67342 RepID=A0ABP3EMQ6_9ACTN
MKQSEEPEPREIVPGSGIDVRGHRVPPLPYACADQAWTLCPQANPDTD